MSFARVERQNSSCQSGIASAFLFPLALPSHFLSLNLLGATPAIENTVTSLTSIAGLNSGNPMGVCGEHRAESVGSRGTPSLSLPYGG
ncbi:hypothetical protein N658DRAFT_225018 [Parathielavia hyrcaniae]|uniref:Uncharacterized protein n=1 Tax=Parathielavia hyrcaniae TaxID=113614 RepID=A0AAN6PZK7_9PEZI|nr:hypothetical protein N658DRAFT_225018 [Parathielavia hyrcaniae]